MSEAVDILMRLKGGRSAAHETRQVGDELGRLGRKARTSGEQAHHSGKNYEFATQRLHLFGRAAVGARERTLGLASAALGVTGAMFGVEEVVRSSVDAWRNQRRVNAETTAAIKSTGGAAHVSARHLDEMARSLQKTTGVDHGEIQSAGNTLLRMVNVRGKIYDRALKTVTDVSAGRHIGLEAASLAVGKALDNPAKGMTRLQRLGISLSDTQQQQIKTFTAFGDTAKAQDIILGALNKRFGGTAKAVATPGMKLKATFTDLKESIGRGLQPAIDAVDTKLLHLAEKAMPYVTKAADDVSKVFNRKDLNLGQKLSLSAKVSKRDLKPLFDQVEQAVKAWHPGQKVEAAAGWTITHLANGFGQGAPKVAVAFFKGFMGASVWGKLATLGFIFWKFGALRSVGASAASSLASGMMARLAATETGTAIAASLGTGALATGTLASLATIGTKMVKLGLGVGIASAIANILGTQNADPLLFLHPPNAGGPGDTLPGGPKHKRPPGSKSVDSIVRFYRKHPKQLDASAYESLSKQEQKQLASVYDHTKFHVLPPLPTGRHSKRHTSGFRASGPVPALAGVVRIDNHHHIYIDGQEMTAVLAPNLPNGDNPKWVSAAVGKAVHDRKARR